MSAGGAGSAGGKWSKLLQQPPPVMYSLAWSPGQLTEPGLQAHVEGQGGGGKPHPRGQDVTQSSK